MSRYKNSNEIIEELNLIKGNIAIYMERVPSNTELDTLLYLQWTIKKLIEEIEDVNKDIILSIYNINNQSINPN